MNLQKLEHILEKHAKTTISAIEKPFHLDDNLKQATKSKHIAIKFSTLAAALLLCVTVISLPTVAKPVKGFFKDIVRIDGAITGSEYVNAASEIEISAEPIITENGNPYILLNIQLLKKDEIPFRFIQHITVGKYRILDHKQKEITKGNPYADEEQSVMITEGSATIWLPLDDTLAIGKEEYTLQIEELYGLSKGDGDLRITGPWKIPLR